jgi:hypothetical protein
MKKALTQEAKQIAAAPVSAPKVDLPSSVPTVKGMSFTTRYHAEVTDPEKLVLAVARGIIERRFKGDCRKAFASIETESAPLNAVMANMPYLNDRATNDKDALRIPGVIARPDTGITGRS